MAAAMSSGPCAPKTCLRLPEPLPLRLLRRLRRSRPPLWNRLLPAVPPGRKDLRRHARSPIRARRQRRERQRSSRASTSQGRTRNRTHLLGACKGGLVRSEKMGRKRFTQKCRHKPPLRPCLDLPGHRREPYLRSFRLSVHSLTLTQRIGSPSPLPGFRLTPWWRRSTDGTYSDHGLLSRVDPAIRTPDSPLACCRHTPPFPGRAGPFSCPRRVPPRVRAAGPANGVGTRASANGASSYRDHEQPTTLGARDVCVADTGNHDAVPGMQLTVTVLKARHEPPSLDPDELQGFGVVAAQRSGSAHRTSLAEHGRSPSIGYVPVAGSRRPDRQVLAGAAPAGALARCVQEVHGEPWNMGHRGGHHVGLLDHGRAALGINARGEELRGV